MAGRCLLRGPLPKRHLWPFRLSELPSHVCCPLQGECRLELTPGILKAVLAGLVTCLLAPGHGQEPQAQRTHSGAATPAAAVLQGEADLLGAVLGCLTVQLPAHLLGCAAEEVRAESEHGIKGALLVAADRGVEALSWVLVCRLVGDAEGAAALKQYIAAFHRFSRLLPPGEMLVLQATRTWVHACRIAWLECSSLRWMGCSPTRPAQLQRLQWPAGSGLELRHRLPRAVGAAALQTDPLHTFPPAGHTTDLGSALLRR